MHHTGNKPRLSGSPAPASQLCKAIVAAILLIAFARSLRRLLMFQVVGFNGFGPFDDNPYYFWRVTEFMVNFEGGFVRRGALGQLLYEIVRRYDVTLLQIIYPLCAVIYVWVTLTLCALFRRRGFCWWIPFIMFLCGYWQSFIRKDFMLVAIMMTSLWVLSRAVTDGRADGAAYSDSPRPLRCVVTVTVLTMLALFLHESYLFWGVPLTALMMRPINRRLARGYVLVSVVAFGVLAMFKGDAVTANAIAASWHPLDPAHIPATPTATIESIGWTLGYAVDHHVGIDFRGLCDLHFFKVPKWIIQLLVLIGASYVVLNCLTFFRRKSTPYVPGLRVAMFACFIVEICCMLPMFILFSNDYERDWQYVFMAVFCTVLIIGPRRMASLLPQRLMRFAGRATRLYDRVLPPNPWATGVVMTVLSAFPYNWDLVHFMYQSPALSLILNRWTLPFFGG